MGKGFKLIVITGKIDFPIANGNLLFFSFHFWVMEDPVAYPSGLHWLNDLAPNCFLGVLNHDMYLLEVFIKRTTIS